MRAEAFSGLGGEGACCVVKLAAKPPMVFFDEAQSLPFAVLQQFVALVASGLEVAGL